MDRVFKVTHAKSNDQFAELCANDFESFKEMYLETMTRIYSMDENYAGDPKQVRYTHYHTFPKDRWNKENNDHVDHLNDHDDLLFQKDE